MEKILVVSVLIVICNIISIESWKIKNYKTGQYLIGNLRRCLYCIGLQDGGESMISWDVLDKTENINGTNVNGQYIQYKRCLDSDAWGNVYMLPCGSTYQLWTFNYVGDNLYNIINAQTGRYLSLLDGGVYTLSGNGAGDHQKWYKIE